MSQHVLSNPPGPEQIFPAGCGPKVDQDALPNYQDSQQQNWEEKMVVVVFFFPFFSNKINTQHIDS